MNNQKRQILRTIRSLESVIESVSHILSGDDLDDINWFITTIKKDEGKGFPFKLKQNKK
jgi:hypothetical protein